MFSSCLPQTLPLTHAFAGTSGSGPPCVAYSKMGKGLGSKDVTYNTHERFYNLLEEEEHDAGLIENVPEYKATNASNNLSDYWGSESAVIDPRLYGQGASRPRRYIIVWNKNQVQWIDGMELEDILECLREHPRLSAKDYFWMDLPKGSLTQSQEKIQLEG